MTSAGDDFFRFQLSLVPTDPKWQGKVPLHFQGLIKADYPAATSLELSLIESALLRGDICQTFDQIMAAEVVATARR